MPTVRRPRSSAPRTDNPRAMILPSSRSLKFWLCLALSLTIVAMCGTATSDETTPDYMEGSGIMGRADHIEGTGIPQIFPITPVQLFPYMIFDESLFFAD